MRNICVDVNSLYIVTLTYPILRLYQILRANLIIGPVFILLKNTYNYFNNHYAKSILREILYRFRTHTQEN